MKTCAECGKPLRSANKTGFCVAHCALARVSSKVGAPTGGLKVMLTPRVDRDPCGYCGVRGDLGCRHQRRAA